MTHLCSVFNINHSPWTPYSPWTNGIVEVQNRILGTTSVSFYKTFQIIIHFKLKCMLMLIIHLYLNLNYPHIKLFFILILVSPQFFPLISHGTLLNLVLQHIAFLFLNIHIIRIKISTQFFTHS